MAGDVHSDLPQAVYLKYKLVKLDMIVYDSILICLYLRYDMLLYLYGDLNINSNVYGLSSG